jgi:hypothetical protein
MPRASATRTARPPTTPPTMAPRLVELLLVLVLVVLAESGTTVVAAVLEVEVPEVNGALVTVELEVKSLFVMLEDVDCRVSPEYVNST